MFIFSWIRSQVRAAFTGGIADGLGDIAGAMNQPGLTLEQVIHQLQTAHAVQPALAPKVDASLEALADKIEPEHEEEESLPQPIAERNGKRKVKS